MMQVETSGERKSYSEAVTSPARLNWKVAMQEEIDALAENSTCTLIVVLANCEPASYCWIYPVKWRDKPV